MNVAIIPAAGQGLRMGGKRAKQFLKLDGIPVIIHTLTRFEQCPDIDQVVVVLPAKDVKGFPALARKFGLRKVVECVAGGKTRAHSVRRGLDSLVPPGARIVAVHDGVRPFVTTAEISQTVRAAKRSGAAILVAPVTDTIKFVRGRTILHTIPRNQFRRALTPQCFRYQLLRDAFQRAGSLVNKATDDSMLVEASERVTFVEGSARNIKITGPEDIALAEIILQQNPEFRIKQPK
jgi:2-C-methyl-D-erythritol 4-phosphate cytidylyltransferase